MTIRDTNGSYGWITRVLHWALFVFIAAQLLLALLFTHWLSGGARATTLWLHQSLGLLILVTGVTFIVWRLNNPRPTLAHLPVWQRGLASLVHVLIYAAIIAQPVFGILMNFGYGFGIPFFGLFKVPAFLPVSQSAGSFFLSAHIINGVLVILPLLGLHILGALYHALARRDGIMRRMWSGRAD